MRNFKTRADRTETCATRLVWEHLVAGGMRVGGDLAQLVDAVLGGDSPSRRATSDTYIMSKKQGLHAECRRLAGLGLTDAGLHVGVRSWLDRKFRDRLPSS